MGEQVTIRIAERASSESAAGAVSVPELTGGTAAQVVAQAISLHGSTLETSSIVSVAHAPDSTLVARVARSHVSAPEAQVRWYALYTSANHERRVAEQLAVRGIEHFLPQYESISKWKDRKVRLQLPLFPGYLFTRIALPNRLAVLQVPGAARFVGFDGHAAEVPEEDLLRVREFLSRGFRAEPHPFLRIGRRVRVVSGPLAGMEGIIVKRKNRSRLVISFALIERAPWLWMWMRRILQCPKGRKLTEHLELIFVQGKKHSQ